MTLKIIFAASLFDAQHKRDTVENSRQVHLLFPWKGNQRNTLDFYVIDRYSNIKQSTISCVPSAA